MDARLIEEVDMMATLLEVAGYPIELFAKPDDHWHVHLSTGGCFAGTTKETHAYLSGAMVISNRVTYLTDKARRQG